MNQDGWQPLETAPPGVDLLTFAPWAERPIGVSSYRTRNAVETVLESESVNAKGRRVVLQEISKTVREWEGDHWEPTHWQPLPPPPTTKE